MQVELYKINKPLFGKHEYIMPETMTTLALLVA